MPQSQPNLLAVVRQPRGLRCAASCREPRKSSPCSSLNSLLLDSTGSAQRRAGDGKSQKRPSRRAIFSGGFGPGAA